MAEVISLTLALPPIVEQLMKVGKNLALRVEALQNPRSKLGDLSGFREHDARLLAQFQVGQQICNDPNVDSDIRDSLAKDFIDIQKVMLDVIDCVERVDKSSRMHRFWIIDKPKRELQECTRRLGALIGHFQDTTELVHIAASLPSQVLLQSDAFQSTASKESVEIADGVLMRHGHLSRAFGRTKPKTGWFICERRPYVEAARKPVEKDIRWLCELLSTATACSNILNIVGYRDLPEIHQFELVFDLPSHFEFTSSLRQFIQTHDPIPLNSRIDLSRQLADAVLLVHRLKMVHKNVNSANVAIFTDNRTAPAAVAAGAAAANAPQSLFLLNFHLVRKASAATQLLGASQWQHGIYQHPTRQLALAEKEYTMAHDIYSLGVCMLELLLWSPLVVRESPEGAAALGAPPARSLSLSELFRAEAVHLRFGALPREMAGMDAGEGSRPGGDDDDDAAPLGPRQIQEVLVSLATRRLPAAAGERLAQLVLSCLTVLEGGFGDEEIVRNNSPVETGLNFVAAVKDSLMQVCI